MMIKMIIVLTVMMIWIKIIKIQFDRYLIWHILKLSSHSLHAFGYPQCLALTAFQYQLSTLAQIHCRSPLACYSAVSVHRRRCMIQPHETTLKAPSCCTMWGIKAASDNDLWPQQGGLWWATAFPPCELYLSAFRSPSACDVSTPGEMSERPPCRPPLQPPKAPSANTTQSCQARRLCYRAAETRRGVYPHITFTNRF